MTTASLPSGKWARTTYIALDDVSARYSFDVSEMDIDRQNYTPSPPTRDASFRHRSARHGSAAKPILAAGNDIPLDDMAARTLPSAQHGRASKTVKISSCESLCAWKVELCASFVSICAMVALVMLLKSYDNRPLTAWTWRAVSLNAMIAILSTCIRVSSMLPVGTSLLQMRWLYARRAHVKKWHGQRLKDLDTFDNASRGPLGSLTMLLTLKPSVLSSLRETLLTLLTPHSQISSVGAILMVLALGFDVFSQQVLTIRSESAVIDQAPGISTVEILGKYCFSLACKFRIHNCLIRTQNAFPTWAGQGRCTTLFTPPRSITLSSLARVVTVRGRRRRLSVFVGSATTLVRCLQPPATKPRGSVTTQRRTIMLPIRVMYPWDRPTHSPLGSP